MTTDDKEFKGKVSISSELYLIEGEMSTKKTKNELEIPDPDANDAQEIIYANTVKPQS